MGYIDCDTHIIECEATWDYFDPSERSYRPTLLEVPTTPRTDCSAQTDVPHRRDAVSTVPLRLPPVRLWHRVHRRCQSPGEPCCAHPARDGRTRDRRAGDHLNKFIAAQLDDPLAEAAVTRSYNRWIAERTSDAGGRLPWVIVPPTRTMTRAFEELEWGKAAGAVGVMLKGIEHGQYLSDPYFYPLYQKAAELDLTMVVHKGSPRRHIEGLGLSLRPATPASAFQYQQTTAEGFYAVIASDLHEKLPELRWTFVEAGSTWVPSVFHHFQRSASSRGLTPISKRSWDPPETSPSSIPPR